MVWSSKYETGNEIVDNDHKEIFGLVKKVLDEAFANRKEKVDTSITFLVEYTLRHFNNEERLMEMFDYPADEADIHKKQHSNFAKSVTALHEKIREQGDTMDIGIEVNNTIVDWLIKHVLGSDMLLAIHCKGAS
ncbi:MAG: bacteriohemerythrin [Defluviitaleaceae bacterium]|nr:bacteriohemerythrin [Defluviitaleaceae bacterium]